MEAPSDSPPHLAEVSKRLARHALVIGENRLELLLVEIQEERDQILCAFRLSLAAAAFGLLAGATLSAAVVVACWNWSPLAALLIVAALHAGVFAWLCWRLASLQRDWRCLEATFEELRKDRECLQKNLD